MQTNLVSCENTDWESVDLGVELKLSRDADAGSYHTE